MFDIGALLRDASNLRQLWLTKATTNVAVRRNGTGVVIGTAIPR
jgi:hypothetical protein